MLELIIKTTLAHLIGDFVLQSDAMVRDMELKKLRAMALYGHAAIHLFLLLLLTGFDKTYMLPVFALSISHLLIDITTKIFLRNYLNSATNFIVDQALHVVTIALFIHYCYPYQLDVESLCNVKNYLLLTALVCVTFVSSVGIRKGMEMLDFSPPKGGIDDAGKYIGMLERLFVFLFVINAFWEGIGFLLAAKSIFRFGDLKENREIKLTEYI